MSQGPAFPAAVMAAIAAAAAQMGRTTASVTEDLHHRIDVIHGFPSITGLLPATIGKPDWRRGPGNGAGPLKCRSGGKHAEARAISRRRRQIAAGTLQVSA